MKVYAGKVYCVVLKQTVLAAFIYYDGKEKPEIIISTDILFNVSSNPFSREKMSPLKFLLPSPKYPVNGFSTITCLFCFKAAITIGSCVTGGVHT
jgi:hypothetical protein